ncbi:MAG: RpoL/Rpb11 RNA polymerase subunit family protein [Candidatus Pacearchaeota archaeon]
MTYKIIKQDKDILEIETDNLTVAELLRNELWQDKATELAVWKREHPSKNPVLVLKTKGKTAKKVLQDTIKKLRERNDELLKEFKKG